MGEFVQHLHLIGFYDVFNLQTRAINWFVYPAVVALVYRADLAVTGGSLQQFHLVIKCYMNCMHMQTLQWITIIIEMFFSYENLIKSFSMSFKPNLFFD